MVREGKKKRIPAPPPLWGPISRLSWAVGLAGVGWGGVCVYVCVCVCVFSEEENSMSGKS